MYSFLEAIRLVKEGKYYEARNNNTTSHNNLVTGNNYYVQTTGINIGEVVHTLSHFTLAVIAESKEWVVDTSRQNSFLYQNLRPFDSSATGTYTIIEAVNLIDWEKQQLAYKQGSRFYTTVNYDNYQATRLNSSSNRVFHFLNDDSRNLVEGRHWEIVSYNPIDSPIMTYREAIGRINWRSQVLILNAGLDTEELFTQHNINERIDFLLSNVGHLPFSVFIDRPAWTIRTL